MTKEENISENRRFGMSPALLMDVIKRQAGSLSKAILESVQNSVDSGSTTISIQIDRDRLVVNDDGKGFESRDEILTCFEIFGREEKETYRKYGRFAMGRGQGFSFGVNTWHTNNFHMIVDIENKGLDYQLQELDQSCHDGCKIEISFYQKLGNTQLDETISEISKWVKYVDIPVVINDKLVSSSPQENTWSFEDENAWYFFNPESNQINIYNHGIFVCNRYKGNIGIGGTVVSKKRLEVNFARNDIQQSCPVWTEIKKVLSSEGKRLVDAGPAKRRITLTDREFIFKNRFMTGDFDHLKDIKIPAVNGRSVALKNILGSWGDSTILIGFAKKGSAAHVSIHENKSAVIFDQVVLDWADCDNEEEFIERCETALIRRAEKTDGRNPGCGYYKTSHLRILHSDEISNFINEDYNTVPKKDWKGAEPLVVESLSAAVWKIAPLVSEIAELPVTNFQRNIQVGKSAIAAAWTDGKKNIWIDRNSLKLAKKGHTGFNQLILLLIHELCHISASGMTHGHDEDFYELYHNISLSAKDPVGVGVNAAIGKFNNLCRQEQDRQVPRGYLQQMDRIEETGINAQKLAI